MTQDTISLRVQDLLHRMRRAIAGSQSTIDPPFGDSPNLPDIYYVDSGNGADGNDGRDPGFPMATIDAAINRCTASQGDVIMVQPGHSETVSTGIALDVIGVSIIGVGEGTLRPQLELTEEDGDGISITAANCRVENIYFNENGTAADEQTGAFINIAAANATIKHCHFDAGLYDQEQITITADGDYATIEDCAFYVTADGPNAGIEIEAAGCVGLKVSHCYFNGGSTTNAWDAGAINSGVAHTLCLIEYNVIDFCAASTGGIEFSAAATGTIQYNTLTNGTLTEMLDPGSCHCIQNFEQDAINESGILFPAINPDGSVGGGAHGGINDTTTDSLHGKLGTDTEMSDRSLWDLLEGGGLVGAPSGAVHGANVNFADMMAWLIDGVRRGSGTINPANISLYDLIGGAGGHPAWPTAAAYANDVSLMEVVGYIQDQVRSPAGAHIPGYGVHITKTVDCSATADIFTITGLVLVPLMFAEVEAAFDGNIGNMSFRIKTSNDTLCAATTVTSDLVKTMYVVSGDPTDTLNAGGTPKPNVGSVTDGIHPMVLGNNGGTETIEMLLSAADSTTASLKIHIYYIPLEASAVIAAA